MDLCRLNLIVLLGEPLGDEFSHRGPWQGEEIAKSFWLDNVTWQIFAAWWVCLFVVCSFSWPFNSIESPVFRGIVVVAVSWVPGLVERQAHSHNRTRGRWHLSLGRDDVNFSFWILLFCRRKLLSCLTPTGTPILRTSHYDHRPYLSHHPFGSDLGPGMVVSVSTRRSWHRNRKLSCVLDFPSRKSVVIMSIPSTRGP